MTPLAQASEALTFLAFFAIAVLIILGIAYGLHLSRRRDECLEELARTLGGKVQTSGFFAFPELSFPHRGCTVTLKYSAGGENESNRTHLTMPWPNGRLRSEIFLEGPFSGLRKLIGMQDIEIGSPHFDRQFIITGNDEAAIKAFLTPDAQTNLNQLLRMETGSAFSLPNLYLQIGGGTLTVTKASEIMDRATLEKFIQLFLQFFESAHAAPSAGIEYLDVPKPTGKPSPHCIVCGEALLVDLVSCQTCRTPHHKDCWQYFGGCATYACGGKKFVDR